MKKIIFYTIIACLSVSFTGCKDFLDVTPPSGFTEEYVFSTKEEAKSAVTGIYSLMLQGAAYDTNIPFSFNPNTDVEFSRIATDVVSLTGGDIACYQPRPIWTALNNTWNTMYSIINLTNAYLEGMANSDLYKQAVANNDNLEVQHMYGELKVLRAVLYLDLIRIWGDVVFRTESSDATEDMMVGVTDRHLILEYLINDLKTVEPTMLYASQLDYGVERASREFCQGLIGLLAMNRAGYALRPNTGNPSDIGYMERGENYNDYYDIAIEYLGKVIDEGKHELKLSFEQLWSEQCNWNTPKDDDILFALPMLKGSSGRFAFYAGIPVAEGSHAYGRASGSYRLSLTYLYSFDNDDLRRDVTCAIYDYNETLNQKIGSKPTDAIGVSSVYTAKWSRLKMRSPLGATSAENTGVNYIWMRYADVLLLYAEAVNERFGPRDDAKNALKTVRKRAFAPEHWGNKVETYVDNLGAKIDFFEALTEERKWEFGGEGIRKYDLARWNKFSEVVYNQYNQLVNWGRVANGSYVPGVDNADVPSQIYYKEVDDTNNPGRIVLDVTGINRPFPVGKPAGYESKDAAASWWVRDESLGGIYLPSTEVRWSFRGFINYNNANQVSPTAPLRYLCPYPAKVITDHRGKIQNYYGFNNN